MKTTDVHGIKFLPISYSFSIEQEVIDAQASVFEHFGLVLNQETKDMLHHEWLEDVCNRILDNEDFDVVVFFDVDCVPLTKNLYEHLLERVDMNTICGIEQTCESNASDGHIYAGPACLAIPKNVLYNVLRMHDRICFSPDKYSDIAQRFTYDCQDIGVNVNFLKVTSVEDPRWRIGKTDVMFGVGTTYDNVIYHHFLIGREGWRRPDFINKCKQIIGE